MPVEDDYFWPLWPLLAALAASPLAFLPAPPERAPKVLARASVTIAAVLAGLMAARCGWNALAYAAAAARRPPTSDQALDEALARRPGDPWVAMLQARRLLRRGDARGAAAALASSGAALAGSHRFRLLLEWAQAKAGDPAALLADTLPPPGVRENFDDDVLERLPLSQAVILERAGRRREALARVASARAAWLSWQGLLANLGEPEANGVQSALLKRASADFLDRVDQDFDDEAPADARLAAELAARDAGGFAPWRRLAERHLKDRDAAERVELTEAESLARAAEDFHWLHLAWLEQGEPARAERDLRRALAAEPARALYWADLGVLRYGRGDARGAEADLRRALELDPALPSAALSLGAILEGSRRAGEARALYERVLDAGVADAGMNAALVEARGRVNASAPRR
jgi:tetratricopeptide (TPR) repeat protein